MSDRYEWIGVIPWINYVIYSEKIRNQSEESYSGASLLDSQRWRNHLWPSQIVRAKEIPRPRIYYEAYI